MTRTARIARIAPIARLIALVAVLALVAAPVTLAAAPRASFNDIEDEVMCDVCGIPLNIAESPRADQQRNEIKQLIAQGKTKQQIKDILVARYGPDILATPDDHGFTLATYIVPIAVVLALLAGLAVLLPRWRRRRPSGGGDGDGGGDVEPALSPADARRLDEDLARFGA
jgi:cytochrome c-type biogenesis protein CcmH